jgi:hypothetical protein
VVRIALLLLGLLPSLAAAGVRYEQLVGQAVDLKVATPLYAEEHWLRFEAERLVERRVLYRCPSGEAFARKQVDYRASELAPAFELEDARFGYREGLRREQDALEAFVRPSDSEAERRAALDEAAALVADAGFDRFVHRHWEALTRGEAVALDFLVPSRGSAYRFRVREAGRLDIGGEPARRVRLSLSGMLGLFAPAIDVAYAESDRRLLRFEGLSNIRLDSGRNAVVRIDFPQPAVEASPADWRAAWQQPLARCRLGADV